MPVDLWGGVVLLGLLGLVLWRVWWPLWRGVEELMGGPAEDDHGG